MGNAASSRYAAVAVVAVVAVLLVWAIVSRKPKTEYASVKMLRAEGDNTYVSFWVDADETFARTLGPQNAPVDIREPIRDLEPPFVLTLERMGGCDKGTLRWEAGQIRYSDKKLSSIHLQEKDENTEHWIDVREIREDPGQLEQCNRRLVFTYV